MFPVSTVLVVIAFCTLPFTFSWPQNLADLAQLGRDLHGYSQSGTGALAHVVGVVSAATIWMHAWSIPGSVLWVSPRYFILRFLCSCALLTIRMSLRAPCFRLFWQRCCSPCLRPSGRSLQHFFPRLFLPFSPGFSRVLWHWPVALSMPILELAPKRHRRRGYV